VINNVFRLYFLFLSGVFPHPVENFDFSFPLFFFEYRAVNSGLYQSWGGQGSFFETSSICGGPFTVLLRVSLGINALFQFFLIPHFVFSNFCVVSHLRSQQPERLFL